MLVPEIFYGQSLYLPIWPWTWKHTSHTSPTHTCHFFKVKHTKLKVSACSRLSLSPESPFKWTHTLTRRPRHDTTTSRLGQAMNGSMNNLTPNIIFPLAVMYTERLACARDVCVCADTRAVCILHFVYALYAEKWLFQQCNVMCGSIIRAVGMTDTQP